MNVSRISISAVAAAALLGSLTVASAGDLSSSANVVRSSVSGYAYQNGGVGQDEVLDMQHHMKPYDLHVAFTQGLHDAYAADVKLHITDEAGGRVFDLKDAGPLTDVNLPAGHYRVVGQLGRVTQFAHVTVNPQPPVSLILHWPGDGA